jgi:hypothetical protein
VSQSNDLPFIDDDYQEEQKEIIKKFEKALTISLPPQLSEDIQALAVESMEEKKQKSVEIDEEYYKSLKYKKIFRPQAHYVKYIPRTSK